MTMQNITPPARAQIGWLSRRGMPEQAIRAILDDYRITAFGPDAARIARSDLDLCVADLRGLKPADIAYTDIIAAARAIPRPSGVVFIASRDLGPDARAALRRAGELVLHPATPRAIVSTIRMRLRLGRLAEETAERLQALGPIGGLHKAPAIAADAEAPQVLVAGAPSPAALAACRVIESIGGRSVCALSAPQTMRALDHSRFDCALFFPSEDTDLLVSLARALQRHREHQRMPIVLVSPSAGGAFSAASGISYASEDIGEDLGDLVRSLTLRARRTEAMKRFLSETAGERRKIPMDAAAYGRRAARAGALSDARSRAHAMIAVQFSRSDGGRIRLSHKAKKLITRIVRAEDFPALIAQNTIAILTSATAEDDAQRIADRAAAILRSFQHNEDDREIRLSTATALHRVQERPEETIARLMLALRTSEEATVCA